MRQPKGIAFVGDWHENHWWGTSVIDAVARNGADTILHVGDYGFEFGFEFRSAIEEACATNDVMLYFIDGNHDYHEWIWNRPIDEDGLYVVSEHVRYIPRGYRWVWWGKVFMGIGGATSVDKAWRKTDGPNATWWATESITSFDMYKAKQGGRVDVMISHDCPMFIQIPGINATSDQNWPAQAIKKANEHRLKLWEVWEATHPTLLVHGHFHTRYDTEYNGTHVIGLAEDGTSWYRNVYVATCAADLT